MSNATAEAADLIRRFFEERPEKTLIASFVPGSRASVSAALRHLNETGEIEVAYTAMAGNKVWKKAEGAEDTFDAFARQELEEKGVDADTAERVVRNTYGA